MAADCALCCDLRCHGRPDGASRAVCAKYLQYVGRCAPYGHRVFVYRIVYDAVFRFYARMLFYAPFRWEDADYDVFRLRLYLVRIVSGCILPCEFHWHADHSAVPLRAVIGDYQMRNRIRSVEKGRLGTKHRPKNGTARSIMNKKDVSNVNAT